MALELNWKDAEWSVGVNAFPPKGRTRSIEDKRKTALNNKMTQVRYSEALGQVVAQIKYGNKYIERGGLKHFQLGACSQEDYKAATSADNGMKLKQQLIAPALDSGEFDKEIQEIATAMAERRKKK